MLVLCELLGLLGLRRLLLLVGWLVSWLTHWLAGYLTGCLVGWLTAWLVGWVGGWLAGLAIILFYTACLLTSSRSLLSLGRQRSARSLAVLASLALTELDLPWRFFGAHNLRDLGGLSS